MTGWPLAVAATDAPAPTFYVAAALYALAALLYLGSLFEGRERIARLARWVLLAAFLSHGGDISWRAMHKLHPGSSVREALGFLAWVLAGGYLLATLRYKLAVVGGLVAPVALGLLLAARLSPAPGAVEDLPTLGRIHIALATLGVALFALATALSAVYLIQERGLKEKKFGGVMFRRGTALETLDMLAHRVVLVGFPIFTIALMLGAVWVARRADGYDRPEYPLALVAWVAFGGLLVARSARGVRGRKAAFLTIVGFAASALVLAIYLGRRALGLTVGSGLFVVGLSWRTAPIEVREKLAFADQEVPRALTALLALPGVGEAVLLSTCNRVEVYGAAEKDAGAGSAMAAAEVRRFLATARGLSAERLADAIYERTETDAVRHVFRVASALDSMVVGESQILGQLKDAYGAAVQAGTAGPLLGRCLERAFGVAKRVRSETAIAHGAANVSSVAVELARRVFGGLAGKIVLLVGAGKMSALAARHLSSDGAATVLVTNRSAERAETLAAAVDGTARPWEDLPAHLAVADVVLCSTGAREPVLSRDLLKKVMKARRHRPIVLIDIAVPRDVEAAAGKIDGVYLFDIDDLERVVAENLKERAREAESAGRIVDAEVSEFARWLRAQGAVPTIRALRERFSQVARAEAERVVRALAADHTAAQREQAILRLADVIVAKLLHSPLSALKGSDDGQDFEALVAAANKLFALAEAKGEAEEQPQ